MIQPQRELQLSESLRYTKSKRQNKSKIQSSLDKSTNEIEFEENDSLLRNPHGNSTLEIAQNRSFCKQDFELSKRASLNFRDFNTSSSEKSFTNGFLKRTSVNKPLPPQRTSSIRSRLNDFDISSLNESELKYFENNLMTEDEASKFEFCYKSIGTNVYTCKCTVNLYSANAKDLILLIDWNYRFTGVPILVFNTGSNPKRRKSLSLIIADKLTAFALWKIDNITFENDFQQPKSGHITFKYNGLPQSSQNLSKKDKDKNISTQSNEIHKFFYLKFSNNHECDLFYRTFDRIRLHPSNKDLFDPKYIQYYNQRKKKNVMNIIVRRITKSHISNPCLFRHINSVPNLLSSNSKSSLFKLDETSSISSINTLVATTINSDETTSSNRIVFSLNNDFQ